MTEWECLDWESECLAFYGRVLTGRHKHWCPDWDFLPVDETCREFECCVCYGPTRPAPDAGDAGDDDA